MPVELTLTHNSQPSELIADEPTQKFFALLEERFQRNQMELDLDLYRILHAHSTQIKSVIQTSGNTD